MSVSVEWMEWWSVLRIYVIQVFVLVKIEIQVYVLNVYFLDMLILIKYFKIL